MSLKIQAQIAQDDGLRVHVAACAAACGITEYPTSWADRRVWVLAAEPGWTDAYEGDGVTDRMIESAVQALVAAETPLDLATSSDSARTNAPYAVYVEYTKL